MSEIQLTEAFLGKIAGWEAMKRARAMVASGEVQSSSYNAPVLRGSVRSGGTVYQAGLVIKDSIDLENLCRCRESRQSGLICAHSVAAGLHFLGVGLPVPSATTGKAAPAVSTVVISPAVRPANARSPGTLAPTLRTVASPNERPTIELQVILPPNLAVAIAKGKIMVCLEGIGSQGRYPLNALPRQPAVRLSSADARLWDAVEALANGETPGMIQLAIESFGTLLAALVAHPRITLGRSQPVQVSASPWRVPLRATLQKGGEIRLQLRSSDDAVTLISAAPPWVLRGLEILPLALPPAYRPVLSAPMTIPRTQVPVLLGRDWALLQVATTIEANFALEDFELEPQSPQCQLALVGGLSQMQAHLRFGYGNQLIDSGARGQDFWLPDPTVTTRYSTRNLAAEQAAIARLLRAGFSAPDTEGRLELKGQNSVLNFFARVYPHLQKEWTVTLEERLERSTRQNLERIEPQFRIVPSGEQWFDLEVSYQSDSGEQFSAADIQRLILSGQSHRRLRNGRTAVIDSGAVEELRQVLLDAAPEQHDQQYRLRNTQAGYLDATLRARFGGPVDAPPSWQARAAQQRGEAKIQTPPLGDLEAVLRPYQKTGVGWLHFLWQSGFCGVLADEMGLGKTVQALGFLQTLFRSDDDLNGPVQPPPGTATPLLAPVLQTSGMRGETAPRPALVVCPTSLVYNWLAEARRFTPRLRILVLSGPDRQRDFERISHHDLVITSYSLLRRDVERYQPLTFSALILDEAQHIKNRQTQNAQVVKAIRAHHRLVLTGTPLENSVLDLWSIFDFLMPGYLGSPADFRERYELPIIRDKSAEAQERLARRVRPFLLRRLKRDVAPDLPAKLEQVSFCELSEDQASVYQQVLEASRREVLAAVGAQGLAKSRMVILTALLRLRQICCDLRLLKLEQPETIQGSGKLDLFAELLDEVLDGGHRVLVFSQFVSMLTILREKLEAEQIAFCYLDGSTTNRMEVVEKFQRQTEIPVFLISLKAGGLGLNLTGADTVIHYDPWWNPAVEDQATDRAHRIGQTRVVTSYKLITRGTVEEKILHLQTRKRQLIEASLGITGDPSEVLSWNEIQELLE